MLSDRATDDLEESIIDSEREMPNIDSYTKGAKLNNMEKVER